MNQEGYCILLAYLWSLHHLRESFCHELAPRRLSGIGSSLPRCQALASIVRFQPQRATNTGSCARAAALLHLHAMPASLWEARRGACIYASESEVIYNSATESVPCGSVDDGFTFNCSCNDVSLAEEKTPRAAIAATVGLAAATISDAKSSAAIPTATWEDMPVSIVGASAGHGR